MSDQSVEIEALKQKLAIQSQQVSQFLDDRKHLEESFEHLRQQHEALGHEKLELSNIIKDREQQLATQNLSMQNTQHLMGGNSPHMTASTQAQTGSNHIMAFNPQSSINRTELHKQIDMLNRQVFDHAKRYDSLKQVENTLLDKLDKRELENIELTDALQGYKEQVQLKGDVISKAQVIIQKLTSKSEQDDTIMSKLNDENNNLKADSSQKQKTINDLHNQLDEIRNKQSVAATQMNDYMGKELDEMRQSLREYQHELNSEKSKYHDQINGLHEQLGQKQLEVDRLQQDLQNNLDDMASKLRAKDGEIDEMAH